MTGNGEDVLTMEQPVVEVSTGQKVAGWVLRVSIWIVFMGGLFGMFGAVVGGMVASSRDAQAHEWLRVSAYFAGALILMGAGSLMWAFAVVASGARRLEGNLKFARWAFLIAVRDLLVWSGIVVIVSAMIGGAHFHGPVGWAVMTLVGAVEILLAVWLTRVIKRMEVSR